MIGVVALCFKNHQYIVVMPLVNKGLVIFSFIMVTVTVFLTITSILCAT